MFLLDLSECLHEYNYQLDSDLRLYAKKVLKSSLLLPTLSQLLLS